MPEALTFEWFSEANRKRCESPEGFNHPLQSWTASDWTTAVVGEFGEAATAMLAIMSKLGESSNIIKKLNRCRDGIPGNKETLEELRAKLRKELGDTFVYLDLTCQMLGFSIAQAAVEVFNAKSEEIGYPERI